MEKMTEGEFEALVAEIGFAPVPRQFRAKLSNVALTIEEEPSPALYRSLHLADGETLLGFYHGIPLSERGVDYGALNLPDKIILFRKPILEAATDDGVSIRHVVEETIWHEVAHHFGLDEDEVALREARRYTR